MRTIFIFLPCMVVGGLSALAPADDFQNIDLNGQSDRQVVVDRESGQYLGHPTTCLVEDGKTMLLCLSEGSWPRCDRLQAKPGRRTYMESAIGDARQLGDVQGSTDFTSCDWT